MSHATRREVAPETPTLVGDPVDVVTGANTDVSLLFKRAGPLPILFHRHYDSAACRRLKSLGWGHAHGFERRLIFDADGVRYERPTAAPIGFPPVLRDSERATVAGVRLTRLTAERFRIADDGLLWEFRFHGVDRPAQLESVARGGERIRFEYSANGQLATIVDSRRRSLQVEHDARGFLARVTLLSPDGRQVRELLQCAYDTAGNLIRAIDAYGSVLRFTYDATNRMTSRTDRRGYTFFFVYDAAGRCIRTRGEDGLLDTHLRYLPDQGLTVVARADGGEWQYFHTQGQVTRIIDPYGAARDFAFDEQGRIQVEVGPTGDSVQYMYEEGRLVGKRDSLGLFTPEPPDFDAPSPRAHYTAASSAEYELGRQLDWGGVASAGPMLTAATTANIPPTLVERDWDVELPLPSDFDVAGLRRRWWPLREREFWIDDGGNLIRQRDERGRTRRWRYDANGNLVRYVDFDGGEWIYEISSWNLLARQIDPTGAAVSFEYDRLEQLGRITDAGGTETVFEHDLTDQLVAVHRHGALRERYARDAAGNLREKSASDGRRLLEYEFGPGRLPLKRVLGSGEEHTYEYDALGRYRGATTPSDSVEFAHDELGNRTTEKRNGRGVVHQYGGRACLTRSVWFDRFSIGYHRTADRSLRIVDPGGHEHTLSFLGHGLVERRLSNGTRERAQYDSANRCLFKETRTATRTWTRTYDWSGEGELRRVEDSRGGTTQHHYDAAHRLRARWLPDGRTERFELDAAGSLVNQPGLFATVTTGNRLATANGSPVEYDERNHLSARGVGEQRVRYQYDECDRLRRVELGDATWEAEYDALGRRTRKTWAGRTTEYFWNGDQLAGEIDADGRWRLYIYADSLALTPLLFLDYSSVDAPIDSGRRYFVFSDQIGTPQRIEDEFGDEVWSAHLRPYGYAEVASDAALQFNLRFPGHYFDEELGLNYNRFRYYDPILGRYLQSDPIGILGGVNVYAYHPNPLERADVRGLGCWSDEAKKGLVDEGFVIISENDCTLVVKSPAGHVYDLTPGTLAPGQPILFAQKGVSPDFSSGGRFKGAPIEHVAGQLTSGDLSPDDLRVQYVWVNGQPVVVNNRSQTTLSKAGMQPTNTEDMTGRLPTSPTDPDRLPSVLERLDEMGGQPSDSMPVRESSARDSPIKENVPLAK
jgi:RHS repeat-associated protein